MASTPYIKIDWSSTSQQPYPQLNDPTPPENDSNKILHYTEQFYDDEDDYFEQLAKAEIEETSYRGNDIPSVSSALITFT
ncbi:hypothetical protein RhiirC2_792182 [Rhizophagus irregularis]|uniref:Uncharacterized protein n=1 Tax=Rhizophagus irregularis TaxID=588596 RepID=A0A2N1MHR3_9GLOM|nr:hypothetical protein RhiirC2_792182 [Rhizophagus irregularis]